MKAMILAAGRGERMRPLTDHTPKPLLPVAGKPLIKWLIEKLVRADITDIVINISHLGTMVEDVLGDGAQCGARIVYSRERDALETAGGIALALPLLGETPFLAVNGDVFSDFDFTRARAATSALSAPGPLAHLILVDNPSHHPAGDYCLDQDRVAVTDGKRLTFSGIGIYHPALFAALAPGKKYQLAALLREPMARGNVTGEYYRGLWIDVGTPERLAGLSRMLAQRR